MNTKYDKKIPWVLIYNDTFSGDTSGDKHGNDITEGFYRLWYHTLLESIVDITKNTGGNVLSVPGKGFNFFRLIFEFENETKKIEPDIDHYLSELYLLKSIILKDHKGYSLAQNNKALLIKLAATHFLFLINKKENIFYEGLKIMANDLNLNMDSINNNLDDLLSRHGMEITDLTGTATDAPRMDSHRGEPEVTER